MLREAEIGADLAANYPGEVAHRLHLVRHAEVSNPEHIVYASLPGFGLSLQGARQAGATARYLGRRPLVAVWSSPLERAVRTAEAIATRVGEPVRVDPALGEWKLMDRWAGTAWDDLDLAFPGELTAFLSRPDQLDFAPESLADLGERVAGAVRRLQASYPHGEVVVVSHQAPIRAATLVLSGEPLSRFWDAKPGHGAVISLQPGPRWAVEATWEPEVETVTPAQS